MIIDFSFNSNLQWICWCSFGEVWFAEEAHCDEVSDGAVPSPIASLHARYVNYSIKTKPNQNARMFQSGGYEEFPGKLSNLEGEIERGGVDRPGQRRVSLSRQKNVKTG